jgi:hypothetical protein
MRRRPRRFKAIHLLAASLVFALLGVATLGWARTGDDPTVHGEGIAQSNVHTSDDTRSRKEPGSGNGDDVGGYRRGPLPTLPGGSAAGPGAPGTALGVPGGVGVPGVGVPGKLSTPDVANTVVGGGAGACRTGWKLIPTCGVLWGVAPGA